jgi:hypothetical protein
MTFEKSCPSKGISKTTPDFLVEHLARLFKSRTISSTANWQNWRLDAHPFLSEAFLTTRSLIRKFGASPVQAIRKNGPEIHKGFCFLLCEGSFGLKPGATRERLAFVREERFPRRPGGAFQAPRSHVGGTRLLQCQQPGGGVRRHTLRVSLE